MKPNNISVFLLTGSLLTGLSFSHNSAFAASLGSCLASGGSNPGTVIDGINLFDQGSNKNSFISDCSVTDLGKVEGRAGVAGAGDYEVAIGLNGAQADLTDRLELDWVDEAIYNWTLNWNPNTNIATFSVGGNSIDYDFDLSASPNLILDKFNAFGIQARADDPSSFITENTAITIDVESITFDRLDGSSAETANTIGEGISVSATSSLSSDNIVEQFYTIDTDSLGVLESEITSMSGTFSMDIPDGGANPQNQSARSRIGFQLMLFDPPIDSASTIPEPTSILSLLTLGMVSLKLGKKH